MLFAKIKAWHDRATLAQLVERLIRNQQVSGSIPEGGSTQTLTTQRLRLSCESFRNLWPSEPVHPLDRRFILAAR